MRSPAIRPNLTAKVSGSESRYATDAGRVEPIRRGITSTSSNSTTAINRREAPSCQLDRASVSTHVSGTTASTIRNVTEVPSAGWSFTRSSRSFTTRSAPLVPAAAALSASARDVRTRLAPPARSVPATSISMRAAMRPAERPRSVISGDSVRPMRDAQPLSPPWRRPLHRSDDPTRGDAARRDTPSGGARLRTRPRTPLRVA